MTKSSAPPAPSAYSKKFNDPRWLIKKAAILQRDKNQCRHCRTTDKHLQVRFVAHRGIDPWEYRDEELETICVDCAKLRGELFDYAVNQIRVLLSGVANDQLERRLYDLTMEAFRLSS